MVQTVGNVCAAAAASQAGSWAAAVDAALQDDIDETRTTIERQLENLEQYRASQEQVIAQFEGDINRFKMLKGID